MRIFYALILFVGILTWSSCGNDDDAGTDDLSITVTADTTVVKTGETLTFSVITNTGEDVTSSSTITVNNTVLQANTFTPAKTGTYSVKATYGNMITTSHYEVVAIDQDASSITISSEQTTLQLGEVFSFTVITDAGKDVTYEAVITADGEPLERERFKPEAPGIFTVIASHSGLESEPITVEALPNSITVEADKNEGIVGDPITFTVFADNDIDITENATILVNDEEIEGNVFIPEEGGTYTIIATYGDLTTESIEITISENFFTLDGNSYETPTGSFAYLGTYEGENGLESIWAFNPFLEIDNGDGTADYPNDVYIYFAVEQPPAGDLAFPSNGTYTYNSGTLPETFDAQIYYDYTAWVGDDEDFESITLEISGMDTWANAETTVESIQYTITKEDGATVTGAYSGPLFAWDASRTGKSKRTPGISTLSIKKGTFRKR